MPIAQLLARTPWRVRVVWDGAVASIDDAAAYTLARADGAGAGPTVRAAWLIDSVAVELALDAPLLDGLDFTLSHISGATAPLAWQAPPSADPTTGESPIDPEAEAFGVDLDWLGALEPGGDLAEVRGIAALREDLVRLAGTRPGELFHRPTEGGDLPARVNGPATPALLGAMGARVRRAFLTDDRVRAASVALQVATDGRVTLSADVRTVPLPDEPIDVRS